MDTKCTLSFAASSAPARPPASRKAASLIEYSMLSGLIAVAAIGSVVGTGTEVRRVFCTTAATISRAMDKPASDCAHTGGDTAVGGGGEGAGPGTGSTGSEPSTGSDPDTGSDVGAGEGGGEQPWSEDGARPRSFAFTHVYGADPGALVLSETITIQDLAETVQVAALDGALLSINGAGFVAKATIANGDTLQVQATAAHTTKTTQRHRVRVGGFETEWRVSTNAGPMPVYDLAIDPSTGMAPYATVYSTPVRITGLTQQLSLYNDSGTWEKYNPTGNTWTITSTAIDGDLLRVRTTAPSTVATTKSVVVRIGTNQAVWSVTTQAQLDTPNFDFIDIAGVNNTAPYHSNEVRITGLTTPARMRFSNHSANRFILHHNGKEILLGNGTGTYWVEEGDRLKLTGSFSTLAFGTTIQTTMIIAGQQDTFSMAFIAGDQDVKIDPLVPVQDDIGVPVTLTRVVSGFEGPAKLGGQHRDSISVNGAAKGTIPFIHSGDTLTFHATTPSSPGQSATYNFLLGGNAHTWTVSANPLRLPVVTSLAAVSGATAGATTTVPMAFSNGNGTTYMQVTTSWGATPSVRFLYKTSGDTLSTPQSGVHALYNQYYNGARIAVTAPPAGTTGTVTVTMRNTPGSTSPTMSQTYTTTVTSQ